MPGSAWIDALVDHVNEEAEEEAAMNMQLEGISEKDAREIANKHRNADVKVKRNRNGTVNLSITAKGGSSIQDVVTGPNGLVCMTVDGVTTTTTGTSAMEQLKQRGSYRRAPEVGAPLAHAAMKPSTWHRRWWHYLKRYVSENKRSVMYALLISPVLQLVFRGSFSLPWVAGYIASIPIIALAMTLVGSYNLRKAMRARAGRLVRNGWPRLEVNGHPGSVPVPFVVSPGEPISEKRGAHPIDPARPAIERLYDLLCDQDYDQGRLAIFENPHAVIDLTVAEAAYLLSAFDYDGGRTEALKLIRSKITDPTNGHLIVEPYDYDSSKREAVKLASDPWNGSPLS